MNIFRLPTKLFVNSFKKINYSLQPINRNLINYALEKKNTLNFVRHDQQLLPQRRLSSTKSKNEKPLPDLIYVPHILRWLKTKLRFKYLQRTWDPEFSEGAFIYGSTQAICRITDIIHENKPEDLYGLVTVTTQAKLSFDMSKKLTKRQRKIIRLQPHDIKILVPISVKFEQTAYEKLCKIKLRVLALKWYDFAHGFSRLVLVALQTEFLRNYAPGSKPEWTISDFDILECSILSEHPPPT